MSKRITTVAAACLAAGIGLPQGGEACTRTLYVGDDETVITGRNMDWMQSMETALWVFPRGMARDGRAGPDSPSWVSKYGSLVASSYDLATSDGMNEKGLVANLLYLAESDYGEDAALPPLSIALWAQYTLDNYATVAEAVQGLTEQPLRVVAKDLPNGKPAALHLSLSDPSGDSAIFEYLDGELVVHHGPEYRVMTNSPPYAEQLAIDTYWQGVGGMAFLPGTVRAADRYARASFLLDAVPKSLDDDYLDAVPNRTYANQAVAQVLSVQRAVSVPLGISVEQQPNLASTLWSVAADQKNRVYYFSSATTPNTFWVALDDLDFSPGAEVKTLPVDGGYVYAGNAAAHFTAAEPFTFMDASGSD